MKVCSVCQRCYEDEASFCVEENHRSFDFERLGGREIIAGIRLDSLLRSEATGKTYNATNFALEQSCLVRITRPAENADRQFLSEAQLISAVEHPNLVRVYQAGVLESGEFFVVTEETSGQYLRECLNQGGPLSEVTAIQIARQTAEGLEAIHAAGLAHRNINPDNIILTSDLEHRLLVKLQNIDFGGLNEQLIISGTSNSELRLDNLRYFSPEQCERQPVDAQTDIYSLGIVLYEMLAGEPPFNAANADELINRQKTMPPPEIKIRNFDIRALLTYTLMDSLQKIPRLRLKKASVFARQLRHIEQLATHSPTPPPVMKTAPVSNNSIPAPQNAAPPIAHKSLEAVELENEYPARVVSKTVEVTAAEPEHKAPIFAPEEPVIEPIAADTPPIDQNEIVPIEPVSFETSEMTEIPLSAPVSLVEWEQPEDIPSEDEIFEVRRTEFGEAETSPALFSVSEEPEFVTDEPHSRFDVVIENETTGEKPASVSPMFAQFAASQTPRVPVGSRLPLIGGGLALIVILAVAAVSYISRESQTVYLIQHPVPKSAPAEKPLPEPDESEVVPEQETAKIENSGAADKTEETEAPDNIALPDYQIPEARKRPVLISSGSKRTEQNQPAKDDPAPKIKQAGTKPVNNGAIKQKPFENVTIYIKPAPAPTKTDGSVRPRVVQAPTKKRRAMPF